MIRYDHIENSYIENLMNVFMHEFFSFLLEF